MTHAEKRRPFYYLTLIEFSLIISALCIFQIFMMATFSYQAAQPWTDIGPITVGEMLKRSAPPSAYLQFHIMIGCLWFIYLWNALTAITEKPHGRWKFLALYIIMGIYLGERSWRFFQFLALEI